MSPSPDINSGFADVTANAQTGQDPGSADQPEATAPVLFKRVCACMKANVITRLHVCKNGYPKFDKRNI